MLPTLAAKPLLPLNVVPVTQAGRAATPERGLHRMGTCRSTLQVQSSSRRPDGRKARTSCNALWTLCSK